jgi:hypothetical protein
MVSNPEDHNKIKYNLEPHQAKSESRVTAIKVGKIKAKVWTHVRY